MAKPVLLLAVLILSYSAEARVCQCAHTEDGTNELRIDGHSEGRFEGDGSYSTCVSVAKQDYSCKNVSSVSIDEE